MSRTVIIFLAVAVVGFVACESSDKSCATVDGLERKCINVNKCRQNNVIWAFRTPLDKENRKYLKSLHCGWENNVPKICCEDEKESKGPSSTMTSDEILCKTSIGTHRSCIDINKCKQANIVSIFKTPWNEENIAYLRSLHCGWNKKMPKICCENEPPFANRVSPFDEPPKAPKSRKVVNHDHKKRPCHPT